MICCDRIDTSSISLKLFLFSDSRVQCSSTDPIQVSNFLEPLQLWIDITNCLSLTGEFDSDFIILQLIRKFFGSFSELFYSSFRFFLSFESLLWSFEFPCLFRYETESIKSLYLINLSRSSVKVFSGEMSSVFKWFHRIEDSLSSSFIKCLSMYFDYTQL